LNLHHGIIGKVNENMNPTLELQSTLGSYFVDVSNIMLQPIGQTWLLTLNKLLKSAKYETNML